MSKKIMTLDDLYAFCSSNNFTHFDAKESGNQICVSTPATFEKAESDDSMLFANIKLLHTTLNRNGSNVTYDAAKKCLGGIKYKPVLANFCEIDGVKDFTSHDMFINDNGELEYLEHQVGCFTADEPTLEEEDGKHWIYAKVAIPREYTAAASIIERKNGTYVSAELAINAMSYDAQKKELLLEDIDVMGVTLLGLHPDGSIVEPGMANANISLEDFECKYNYEKNDKLIETLERLNETLKGFDINSTRKEDDDSMSENEELETVEETSEVVEEEVVAEEVTELEEETNDETETEVNYSVSVGEVTKNFSLSLNSKLYALHQLINDTYADDGDYYSVEVFEDENVVEMHGWMKSYRQSFKCKKKCEYSLTGDRVEIFSKWMTQDEISAFERMKANYEMNEQKLAEVSEKLAKYEAEPSKMEILNSNDYAQVSECEDYKALVNEHFDLSIDEVRTKADSILLNYAKTHTVAAENNNTVVTRKDFSATNKKTGRYGNIFAK